jgi:hypothetical protein
MTTVAHIDKEPNAGSPRLLRPPANQVGAARTDALRRTLEPLRSPHQLRREIARRLEQGASLDAVERELIAPSALPKEQQSALWLYAWSLPQRPPPSQPRHFVWAALGNALLTLVGIYRY